MVRGRFAYSPRRTWTFTSAVLGVIWKTRPTILRELSPCIPRSGCLPGILATSHNIELSLDRGRFMVGIPESVPWFIKFDAIGSIRPAEFGDGHGILKSGPPPGLLWSRSISDLTS